MKTLLLCMAAIGLAVSGAYADCAAHKSVQAESVDKTVVASVVVPQSEPVAVPTVREQTKADQTAE